MALNYLHENNYVHRDIKPENILFSSKKTDIVKIVDFGTCKTCMWKAGQKLTDYYGTPYYMSPELLQGSYSNKTDLWSVGVIMFSMVLGHVPFDGYSNQDIFRKTINEGINFETKEFRRKSIECTDLLKKLLYKAPESRISAMDAIQHKWLQTYAFE